MTRSANIMSAVLREPWDQLWLNIKNPLEKNIQLRKLNIPEMVYSTFIKLYDNCVAPILHYASCVLGHMNYCKIDQLHSKAQCIYLGVHRFAAKLGIERDMGWLLKRSQRHIKMLRFWNRLMQISDNRLTKHSTICVGIL